MSNPPSHRLGALLALLLIAASLSCGRASHTPDAETTPSPPQEAEAKAPAEKAKPLCEGGEARCTGLRSREVCAGSGAAFEAAEACEPAALCLDGGCVTPKVPVERLSAIGEGGWLNGWSRLGPLPISEVDELIADRAGLLKGERGWRAACGVGGGVVPARPKLKRDPRESNLDGVILAGYLVSGAERDVLLKVGVQGEMTLYAGEGEPLRVRRDAWASPHADEQAARVSLKPGLNPVVIAMKRLSRWPVGLRVRLRALDGGTPEGVRFAPLKGTAPCPIDKQVTVAVTQRLEEGAIGLEVKASLPGLVPPNAESVVVSGRFVTRSGDAAPGRCEPLTLTDRWGGDGGRWRGVMRCSTPTDEAGPRRLVVEVGEAVVHRRELLVRPEAQARFLKVRGSLKGEGAPEPSRASAAHLRATVARLLTENDPDDDWLEDRLKRAEAFGAELAQGRDPYATARGVVRRAYRSPLDGSLQRYVAWVPPSYDELEEGEAMPLVVVFHGLGSQPEHALQVAIGRAPMINTKTQRSLPRLPDQRAILVAPLGYGDAGQRPLGEHDVLEVIDQMKAAYRIDPRRVSLTGYSLGGTVAFVVPLHYPDRFSGAAPLCGYPNLKGWREIRTADPTPWEEILIDKTYIRNYAENGRHLPLHVVHGGRDGPERSEVMVNRYRRLGYRVWYDLQDDLGHNVWDHAYERGKMIGWLKRRRQPDTPTRVRLRTADYRYDRAWWVRLIASRDYDAVAEIRADLDEDDATLTVTTENAAAFALDLAQLRDVVKGEQVAVKLDGAELKLPTTGTSYLVRADGGWRVADAAPDRSGHKRHNVAGPLPDALLHRQLIVYGTGDPAQTEANQLAARWASQADPRWDVRYPVKADRDVTDQEMREHTLVLIGNPASNALTARLREHLPVTFEPGALVLGDGRRFEGEEVGVSLIHPHPENPDEYLVLHAGVGPQGTLASRHLPRYTPDYLVYDQGITTQRHGTLLGDREVLAGGFFTQAWGFPKE